MCSIWIAFSAGSRLAVLALYVTRNGSLLKLKRSCRVVEQGLTKEENRNSISIFVVVVVWILLVFDVSNGDVKQHSEEKIK